MSIVKLMEQKFTVSVLQDADRYQEQVQQRFETLSNIMDPLSFFEPKKEKKNNEVVDQYQSKMETALDQLAKYVADNTDNEDGATSATTSGVSCGKERLPNKLLAPAVLRKDDTPEKMRNWVIDFTTFLQSGDALSVATRQAYFRCLIDHHLRRATSCPTLLSWGKGDAWKLSGPSSKYFI